MTANLPATNPLATPFVLGPDPDAKVDRPGVWTMSMAQYHWDCAPAPSLSSSGLRTIWAQSPAHYFLGSPYNADAWEWRTVHDKDGLKVKRRLRKDQKDDARPHFSLGRAAHHILFLGRKGFEDEYAIRPDRFPDWRTDRAKAWRAAAWNDGKTVLTDEDLVLIAGMARSLREHPMVKAGILDGYVERSLLWQDPETGLWQKSRPDVLPTDNDGADLKTMSDLDDESMLRSISTYGYHCQGALVRTGMRQVLGRELNSFTLVCVEPKPPHCVRVVTLKDCDLDMGERQNRAALRLAKDAFERGRWDGPGGAFEDATYVDLPTWYRTRTEARLELMEAGYDG
jgi:hypothetical protein